MRAKLITPWFGPLPVWIRQFQERMSANRMFCWELVTLPSLGWINELAAKCTGTPCRKASHYAACCDLRPLFGEMFMGLFAGYDWWGWCDLDIIVGNLDEMLAAHLHYYDVISTEFYVMNGAMSLLRNNETCRGLYRTVNYQDVLASPDYKNFDEGGGVLVSDAADRRSGKHCGGFTQAVVGSGLKVHLDDRSWGEGRAMLVEGCIPSRTCHLHHNRLIEIPTDREILLYHLGSKRWRLDSQGEWI